MLHNSTSPAPSGGTSALDVSAIGLSTACALHCLILPMFVAFGPVFAAVAEAEWLHKGFVLAALPISGLAMARGLMREKPAVLFAIGAGLGLVLLITAAFVEAVHERELETPITLAGAALVAMAHIGRLTGHKRS